MNWATTFLNSLALQNKKRERLTSCRHSLIFWLSGSNQPSYSLVNGYAENHASTFTAPLNLLRYSEQALLTLFKAVVPDWN